MLRMMPSSACRAALFCIAFYCAVCLISAQKESPEMVAKWRSFVQSLSPELRKKFDALHAEAGKMEPGSVQKRVEDFLAELSPAQKKQYKEIQQRGGGGGGERGGIGTEDEDTEGGGRGHGGGKGGSAGRGGSGRGGSGRGGSGRGAEEVESGSAGRGGSGRGGGGRGGGRGGDEEVESGRGASAGRGGGGRGGSGKAGGGEEESESGSAGRGGMEAKLDEWIGRSDLSAATRQAMRKVKDIYMRSEMESPEKCEQIQRQLKIIGTGDKAKLNIPTKLLTMDCAEAGTKGPQNLVAGIGTGRYTAKSGNE